MTQILKGENPFHRDCSSPGLDVTQTDCTCGEEEGAGSFLRIACTKLCKSSPPWSPEGLKTLPTPRMASSQRAVLLLPRLRAVISTPLPRHQLPTTAGLGSGLPPSQRRAQRAIEEPTLLTAALHPPSASAPRLGTLGPSSGSTTAALCPQSTSEFQTSPHAPQGDRRRAIGSKLNNAMWR